MVPKVVGSTPTPHPQKATSDDVAFLRDLSYWITVDSAAVLLRALIHFSIRGHAIFCLAIAVESRAVPAIVSSGLRAKPVACPLKTDLPNPAHVELSSIPRASRSVG